VGLVVALAIRLGNLRGTAACHALALVIILPFLSPLAHLLPRDARVEVPSPAAILPMVP